MSFIVLLRISGSETYIQGNARVRVVLDTHNYTAADVRAGCSNLPSELRMFRCWQAMRLRVSSSRETHANTNDPEDRKSP